MHQTPSRKEGVPSIQVPVATEVVSPWSMCPLCNKLVPGAGYNLLRASVRMKAELARLTEERESLAKMLKEADASTQSHRHARVKYESVLRKSTEVLRNRKLHDCEAVHTNSRKREYQRWDRSMLTSNQQLLTKLKLPSVAADDGQLDDLSVTSGGDKEDPENIQVLETQYISDVRDDEALTEEERVRNAINKIRLQHRDGLLAEIQLIKERHRTLEALTLTKNKAAKQESRNQKRSPRLKRSEGLKELLLDDVVCKEETFKLFKEKTTLQPYRNFRFAGKEQQAGVTWNQQKWNPLRSTLKGQLKRNVHPHADAKKTSELERYEPVQKGDLMAYVFLPKHVTEALTPVESALRLDRFLHRHVTAEATSRQIRSGEPPIKQVDAGLDLIRSTTLPAKLYKEPPPFI